MNVKTNGGKQNDAIEIYPDRCSVIQSWQITPQLNGLKPHNNLFCLWICSLGRAWQVRLVFDTCASLGGRTEGWGTLFWVLTYVAGKLVLVASWSSAKDQGSGSLVWSLSMWACQCGLGFLTAWWLGSQGEHSERERERERETRGRYIAFMIWPQSHIVSLLLNSVRKAVTKVTKFQKGGHVDSTLDGE